MTEGGPTDMTLDDLLKSFVPIASPSSTSGGLSARIPGLASSSSPSPSYALGCSLLLKCLREEA